MRAVRVECATPSIEHDPRVQEALRAVSWDYRGTLDQIDGRLRVMCECITVDGGCPAPGFSIGGVTVVEILEEWSARVMVHYRWHYPENTAYVLEQLIGVKLTPEEAVAHPAAEWGPRACRATGTATGSAPGAKTLKQKCTSQILFGMCF